MSVTIIDGKAISSEIKQEVKTEVEQLKKSGIQPCLAVVLVGENSASKVYVNNKKRLVKTAVLLLYLMNYQKKLQKLNY